MDRIRAGLTGLGAVFLVTAAASLLFAPDPAEQAKVEAEQAKDPGEPLAQLGVAPKSERDEPPAPAPAPEPAQPSGGTARPSGGEGATALPPGQSPVDGRARPGDDRPVTI